MQVISEQLLEKVKSLVSEGKAHRVFGWKKGELGYDTEPSVFENGNYEGFVYDSFCVSNLSKYMINETKKEGKVLLLLKPCDSYGFELLVKEHRIDREKVYALGIPCAGKVDIEKIDGLSGIIKGEETADEIKFTTLYGDRTILKKDYLYDKCKVFHGKTHKLCDEVFMPELSEETDSMNRFDEVEKLEKMSSDERFEFWRGQFSKCIRCNACRNVCPACSCVKCVFDNDNSGVASKANADDFEENMFHIIRSFHVCGRCIDCGECSRVCPQKIPLHLLNRKYIKDINELYGENEDESALLCFSKDDPETTVVYERGDSDV